MYACEQQGRTLKARKEQGLSQNRKASFDGCEGTSQMKPPFFGVHHVEKQEDGSSSILNTNKESESPNHKSKSN